MRQLFIRAVLIAAILPVIAGVAAAIEPPAQSAKQYVCPPCDDACHDRTFDEPGRCPVCTMRLIELEPVRNVAVVVFDGVEPMDFIGPADVLARAHAFGRGAFNVYLVGQTAETVKSGFLTITPSYTFADAPAPEIVIVPGGAVENVLRRTAVIDWINENGLNAEVVLSVGGGALLLAKCGMLDDVEVTTSEAAVEALRMVATKTKVLPVRRIVDNGDLMTASGASAGIDAGLHIVKRVIGDDVARKCAAAMAYDWLPEFDYGLIDYIRDTGITDRLMPYVTEVIGEIERRLAAGRLKTADVIADPVWSFIHEIPAFREAIKKYAAGSTATLVTEAEPGERLLVSGMVKDGDGKPVAGALVYVYHTDHTGVYSSTGRNTASMGDSLNPRLFGYLKTGANGRYSFSTIRPGGYPDGGPPAHVHFEVRKTLYADLITELMFEGDPRLTDENRAAFEKQGFVITKIEKGADGINACICDLTLAKETPSVQSKS